MKLKSSLKKIDNDTNIILSFENGAISVKKKDIGKGYKSFNVNKVSCLNNNIKIDISNN